MNSILLTNRNQSGFTLLEVIVTLIIASILGAVLYQFMGTNLTQSAVSVVWAKDQFELNGVMEKMVADYRNFVETGTIILAEFKEDVENNTPHPGGSYGDYTVEYSEYVHFPEPDYVESINPPDNKILKVTIRKGDQRVTTLFTK